MTAPGTRARPRGPRMLRRQFWTRRRVLATTGIAAVVVIGAYTVICIAAAAILTRGTHRPLTATASAVGSAVADVSFPSRVDHLTIRGWLARSSAHTGRSVIMVHGRDSNRTADDFGAVTLARDLLSHGYDTLMFDLRSSGESEGGRFTLGNEEPRDLLGAYDFMTARGYAPAAMAVIGWSEGAATVLEAAPQLDAVGALVADSAFADLAPILTTQLPKHDPLPRVFDWGTVLAARVLFDFDPNLRPIDAVRAVPQRAFLFFAGADDDTIPPDNGRELRAASASTESRLVVVRGAGHVQEFKTEPTTYLTALYGFLDQQLGERARTAAAGAGR